jgi:4-hydroxy-tetrahydrodipicolinate synthase
MSLKPKGIIPPIITPMDRDGNIDEEALSICLDFWVENGVTGLAPCGSNGEAPYLSRDERKRVIKLVVNKVGGKIPVIAGTGALTTKETVTLTRDAEEAGADGALVITPYYYKLSEREFLEHYREVIRSTRLPIIIYNVPLYTGVNLPVSVVVRLAESDRVVGIKETSGSIAQIAELIRLVGDKISVLGGTTDVILPTLALGGKGALIGIANVIPKLCRKLYDDYADGRIDEARKIQLNIMPLNAVLFKKYNPVTVKEALKMMGLPGGHPRKPLQPLNEEEKREIAEVMKGMKLIPQ